MGFYMNYNREAKSLAFRRGSEVSQEMYVPPTIKKMPECHRATCTLPRLGHDPCSWHVGVTRRKKSDPSYEYHSFVAGIVTFATYRKCHSTSSSIQIEVEGRSLQNRGVSRNSDAGTAISVWDERLRALVV